MANAGSTSPDAILCTIGDQVSRGNQLLAVGCGLGYYDGPLMEKLADGGNGWYVYVDDSLESDRVFADRFNSTIDVAALDAKIQVEINSTVVRQYRLIGFENRAVVDNQFTAVYEVELVDVARTGSLGTIRWRWTDAKTKQPAEIHKDIDSSAIVSSFNDANARLQHAVVVAWTAY